MKTAGIVIALIAMMLFAYGCGEQKSADSGKEPAGDTAGADDAAEAATGGETEPETGGGTEPATGGETEPETGGGTEPATGGGTEPATGGETEAGGEETPDTGGGEERPDTGEGTEPAGIETVKYEFEKGGMVLTIPKDWKVSIKEDAEENLLTADIKPSDGSLGSMEMNVSILATGEATLEQFVAEVIKELKKEYPDLKPKKDELTVGAMQAVKINGEFKEDGVKYKGAAVLMVKDGFGYIVLYGIPIEDFAKYEKIHKTLYETLEITKAPQLPGVQPGGREERAEDDRGNDNRGEENGGDDGWEDEDN
ncbi:MAG: hypothetical protein DRP79_01350 [Planctomycetota bacterium]|nr:MAG: hypothetical protein DRP79_01350 [Planctomycetota bacterium]